MRRLPLLLTRAIAALFGLTAAGFIVFGAYVAGSDLQDSGEMYDGLGLAIGGLMIGSCVVPLLLSLAVVRCRSERASAVAGMVLAAFAGIFIVAAVGDYDPWSQVGLAATAGLAAASLTAAALARPAPAGARQSPPLRSGQADQLG